MATSPGGNGFNVLRDDIIEIKTDVKELVMQLRGHIESPGHPLMLQDIDQLKKDVDVLKSRPIKTWQVVTAVVGLIATVIFVMLSCGGFAISLFNLWHTLHP